MWNSIEGSEWHNTEEDTTTPSLDIDDVYSFLNLNKGNNSNNNSNNINENISILLESPPTHEEQESLIQVRADNLNFKDIVSLQFSRINYLLPPCKYIDIVLENPIVPYLSCIRNKYGRNIISRVVGSQKVGEILDTGNLQGAVHPTIHFSKPTTITFTQFKISLIPHGIIQERYKTLNDKPHEIYPQNLLFTEYHTNSEESVAEESNDYNHYMWFQLGLTIKK